jgi:esterase/lipase
MSGKFRLRHKVLIGLAAGIAGITAVALATAPPALQNHAPLPQLDGQLDDWLAQREREVAARTPLIEGTEKRIRWFQDQRDQRADYSIVYFPGFSATRQEIVPVAEMVADDLGANLFETRLSGHGLAADPLVDVRAEDWLRDAAEALEIGSRIGDKVIVMGTSTGATLALAMMHHQSFEQACCIVLISPNFATRDSSTELLTWPGGLQLAYAVAGRTRSWNSSNELQRRYWHTSYPMDVLVEMMRLVKYTRTLLPVELGQSLLVFYSPKDRVVDSERIVTAFGQMQGPHRKLVPVSESGDPSHHVLAGDIMSPGNNEMMVDEIVRFIREEDR